MRRLAAEVRDQVRSASMSLRDELKAAAKTARTASRQATHEATTGWGDDWTPDPGKRSKDGLGRAESAVARAVARSVPWQGVTASRPTRPTRSRRRSSRPSPPSATSCRSPASEREAKEHAMYVDERMIAQRHREDITSAATTASPRLRPAEGPPPAPHRRRPPRAGPARQLRLEPHRRQRRPVRPGGAAARHPGRDSTSTTWRVPSGEVHSWAMTVPELVDERAAVPEGGGLVAVASARSGAEVLGARGSSGVGDCVVEVAA